MKMFWRTREPIKRKWMKKGILPAIAGAAISYGLSQIGGEEGGMETIPTWNPQQRKAAKKLFPYLTDKIGEGLPGWEEPFTAEMGEMEEFGLGQYKEAISGFQPEEVSDWYMKYIAPSEARYLKDVSIPTFKESMVPGGNLRSTGTERGISDIVSRHGEQQLGRIGEAIMGERQRVTGALPGYMAAAGLPRMIEQQEITSQFEEMKRTTPELSPIIDKIIALLGEQTQAAYYQEGKPSIGASLSPYIGSAIGSYYGSKDED